MSSNASAIRPERLLKRIDDAIAMERELRDKATKAESERVHSAAATYMREVRMVRAERYALEDAADAAEDQGLVADPAAMSEEEYCSGLQASAGLMELHHLEVFVREWASRHRHEVRVTEDGDVQWVRAGLRLVSGGG